MENSKLATNIQMFKTNIETLQARIHVLEISNSKLATRIQTLEDENAEMRCASMKHQKEHEIVSAVLQALQSGSDDTAAAGLARLQLASSNCW